MDMPLPFPEAEGESLSYYLVILNGDGCAEVLTVPQGDDPHFIAKYYDVLDIYQTQAQAAARCDAENRERFASPGNCADGDAVK